MTRVYVEDTGCGTAARINLNGGYYLLITDMEGDYPSIEQPLLIGLYKSGEDEMIDCWDMEINPGSVPLELKAKSLHDEV